MLPASAPAASTAFQDDHVDRTCAPAFRGTRLGRRAPGALGVRLSRRVPERLLRRTLGLLVIAVGLRYLVQALLG